MSTFQDWLSKRTPQIFQLAFLIETECIKGRVLTLGANMCVCFPCMGLDNQAKGEHTNSHYGFNDSEILIQELASKVTVDLLTKGKIEDNFGRETFQKSPHLISFCIILIRAGYALASVNS